MYGVGKRDDFGMDQLFYYEPVQRFEYWGDMFSFGVQLLRKQRSFAVDGDEIFAFAVSLGKMSWISLIQIV